MVGVLLLGAPAPVQDVFLTAGQSNAGDGNGLTSSDLNAHSVASDAGIQIWNGSAFVTLVNATNNDILQDPTSHTWGPEVEFAYQWRLANPTKTLYLVPYRVANTLLGTVSQNSGVWAPPPNVGLFSNMTAFAAAAKAALPNPIVRGVLWIQGENDATDSTFSAAYQTNLTNLCSAIQTYWGEVNTKILIGRIADNGEPFASTVQAAQDAVGVALPTSTRVINTDAFGRSGVHYTGTGQVSLGGAMYTAYLTF